MDSLVVVQYNIYFGDDAGDLGIRTNRICDMLLDIEADCMCLQEVKSDMFQKIRSKLCTKWKYIYPKQIEQTYDTMILSTSPIYEQKTIRYEKSMMGRNLKYVIIDRYNGLTDTNQLYCIATTHFESEFKHGDYKKVNQGDYTKVNHGDYTKVNHGDYTKVNHGDYTKVNQGDYTKVNQGDYTKVNHGDYTKYLQFEECANILNEIWNNIQIPVILCCDSNVIRNDENHFYQIFDPKIWYDCWIANGNESNKITYDPMTNPILLTKYQNQNRNKNRSRLDRILHMSNLIISSFDLIGLPSNDSLPLSDHYGIIVKFNQSDNLDKSDKSDKSEKSEKYLKKFIQLTTKSHEVKLFK